MGRYRSYLLPLCPSKMAELSQWEVVTDEMGHPVVRSLLLVAHILRARRILGLQAAQGRPRVLAAAQGCLHWA